MARVNLVPLAVGAGVGILDEVFEGIDRKRPSAKPFRNVTDWARVVALGAGVTMTMMDFQPEIGRVLTVVGAALTVKSLSRTFREGLSLGAGTGQSALDGRRREQALRATRALNAAGTADRISRVSLEPLTRRTGLS